MKNKKRNLVGLFCLDHKIRLYVPGTVNTDQPDPELQQKYVNKAMILFSNCFGGSTEFDAVGAWNSKVTGLVTESIKIVESYATKEQIEDQIDTVLNFATDLKSSMNQEAISLEYDNKLYFI